MPNDLIPISNYSRIKTTNKDIQNLKLHLLSVARYFCPKDTTNMAENAIYVVNTIDGFKIVWNDKYAYYMPYVNEGKHPFSNSVRIRANKGFVDFSIVALALELRNFLTDRDFSSPKLKREAPKFVQMLHDMQSGKEKAVYKDMKNNSAMMSRLIKSVKQYEESGRNQEVQDFEEVFQIKEQKVYEEPYKITKE